MKYLGKGILFDFYSLILLYHVPTCFLRFTFIF